MSERSLAVLAELRDCEPEIVDAATKLAEAMGRWRKLEGKVDKLVATAAPGAPEERLALALHGVCNHLSLAVCKVPDPFWAMMLANVPVETLAENVGVMQFVLGARRAPAKAPEPETLGEECRPVVPAMAGATA